MPIADPAAAAATLYEARRTGSPIEPLTAADPGLGMADGYAVQQHLVRMLLEDGEKSWATRSG
jgi:2-keto-4-pentenoate hydratase